MHLDTFFKIVRDKVFHGRLTNGQVEGMEKIIAYRDSNYSGVTNDQLAYILATVAWETGYKMVPVKEAGSEAYLRSKRYFPHIGVGLVQVTWARNWERFGIRTLQDGLSWPVALHACFAGMVRGMFTGKKLSDYIANGRCDYVGARRIINGTDRAKEIANMAVAFRRALIDASGYDPKPVPPPQPEIVFTYEQFRAYLLKALAEDSEVRGMILAVVFPEDPPAEESGDDFAPMEPPEDEYLIAEDDPPEPMDEPYSFADMPHERYG